MSRWTAVAIESVLLAVQFVLFAVGFGAIA